MKLTNLTKQKRILVVIPIFFITIFLSGCWSSVEIHDIAFINTMAIDFNTAGDYEISVVISNPSALFSQTFIGKTGGNQKNRYLIETETGRTIFEAIGKLSHSISEKIYLGHMDVIIFGEKVAREKMEPSIDFFHREYQVRPNVQLLIAKGKASDILNTQPEFNTTLGIEIMDYTKPNRYSSSKLIQDISQFMKVYTSDTTDAITGVLFKPETSGEKAKDEQQESKSQKLEKPKVTSLAGTAVFKDGHLKGFLDNKETHGLLWIKGAMKNEIFVLSCGNNDKGKVSIVVRDYHSQFIPHIENDGTSLTIKTDVEAEIGEVTCGTLNLTSEQVGRLNQQLQERIVKESNTVLNKAQKQWQADIFGFGQAIYRMDPKQWDKMAKNWRNGGLKDLTINFKVKANLSRAGLRKDASKANESR